MIALYNDDSDCHNYILLVTNRYVKQMSQQTISCDKMLKVGANYHYE